MTTYDFTKQLERGEQGETRLDGLFAQREYLIRPATRDEQRRGIDRWMTNARTGKVTAVEYKTDDLASKTGNAFIETVSVDTANKPGWAYSSEAEFLIYYLPQDELIYIVPFERLRRRLPRWEQTYPKRSAQNEGYQTHGLLVPLCELEGIAYVWEAA